MMENRSFDHILGSLPHVDGVDLQSPFTNVNPVTNLPVPQAPGAADKLSPDPEHATPDVLRQINVAGPHPTGPRDMSGFLADYAAKHPNAAKVWPQVMAYYTEGQLPATFALAKAFCVCDRWFSSVPGPTWTNRFFMHSGTSQGWVEMPRLSPPEVNLHKYDQDTIFDRLYERGIAWRIYVGDIAQSLLLSHQREPDNLKRYRRWQNFATDVQTTDPRDFPAYVFIEPRYMPFGQNDQHPPADIRKGDELIASVYNAIRQNAGLWDKTLLIVTYDEHGGFCDHRSPPDATPPDSKAQDGFDFTMYGVRVPAILISKWVQPGSVFRPSQGFLDHTSILRFLIELHGLGSLGNRTASAASLMDAIVATPNENTPFAVGVGLERPARVDLLEAPSAELNPNQVALIEFTKWLEMDRGTAPEAIGLREMRGRVSVQGAVTAAIERFWEYVDLAQ
jgi:phospholipase C